MARAPDDRAVQAKEMYLSGKKLIEISVALDVSAGTVRSWKNRYEWDGSSNATLQKKKRNVAKHRGAQPGNKNATGPPGNNHAEKHGLFSKYLPPETLEIVNNMTINPLDILWDQIRIAYAAIIRSQQIMYVKDQKDKTKEKIEKKDGNVFGEKWEVQQAWDKQANFLQAQAKAQSELRSLIKQYDEMIHKDWNAASEEQKVRIAQMKAQTERLKKESPVSENDGVEIINDAPKETD